MDDLDAVDHSRLIDMLSDIFVLALLCWYLAFLFNLGLKVGEELVLLFGDVFEGFKVKVRGFVFFELLRKWLGIFGCR